MIKANHKWLNKVNDMAIAIYVLIYIVCFCNIEEMLVIHLVDWEYHPGTIDSYAIVMFFVGISFSTTLVSRWLLTRYTQRVASISGIILNTICTFILLIVIFRALDIGGNVEFWDTTQIVYHLLCGQLVVFVGILVILHITQVILSIRSLREAPYERAATVGSIQSRKLEWVKSLLPHLPAICVLLLSMLIYERCTSSPFLEFMIGCFSLLAVGIPFALFIIVVLRHWTSEHKYIHAIGGYMAYGCAVSGAIRHLIDKYYDWNISGINLVPTIHSLANVVAVAATILALIIMLIRHKKQCQSGAVTTKSEGKGIIFGLIGCVMAYVLLMPYKTECYEENGDATCCAGLYSITIINAAYDQWYFEDVNTIGIEVKVLGTSVYKVITYTD